MPIWHREQVHKRTHTHTQTDTLRGSVLCDLLFTIFIQTVEAALFQHQLTVLEHENKKKIIFFLASRHTRQS